MPPGCETLNCYMFRYLYNLHWELNLFEHPVYGDWVGHVPSLVYDFLDGPVKRLHANFQVSASLSKKVLIFLLNQNGGTYWLRNSWDSKICVDVPSNVYKNISKELCDSSTYIETRRSWREQFYILNAIGVRKYLIPSDICLLFRIQKRKRRFS